MFYAASTTPPSEFFNRQAELAWLRERRSQLRHASGQPLALTGLRKTGKTSLLNVFLAESLRENIPCLSMTVPFNPDPKVFCQFLGTCLTYFLSAHKIEFNPLLMVPQTVDKVILDLASFPKSETIRLLIRHLQLFQEMNASFQPEHVEACLEFPATYWSVQNKRGIIVWDEFQNLLGLAHDTKMVQRGELLGRFREVWQHHHHILYIICGSEVHLMEAILNNQDSPFFSHFQQRHIGPFCEEDIVELIMTNGKQAGCKFSKELCQHYYRIMGGIPFYAQVIGDCVVQQGAKKPSWRDFQYALQRELWHPEGRLSLYFQNLMDQICGHSSLKRVILTALSRRKMTVKEIAQVTQSFTGSISNALPDLRTVIDEKEGVYGLKDPAFELWLNSTQGLAITLSPAVKGNEAELKTAHDLARYGIHSFFSNGSRSAIDLLIQKGEVKAALQIKLGPLPFYWKKSELLRFKQEARSWGILPVLAVVMNEEKIFYFDVRKATSSDQKTVKFDRKKAIADLLKFLFS